MFINREIPRLSMGLWNRLFRNSIGQDRINFVYRELVETLRVHATNYSTFYDTLPDGRAKTRAKNNINYCIERLLELRSTSSGSTYISIVKNASEDLDDRINGIVGSLRKGLEEPVENRMTVVSTGPDGESQYPQTRTLSSYPDDMQKKLIKRVHNESISPPKDQ